MSSRSHLRALILATTSLVLSLGFAGTVASAGSPALAPPSENDVVSARRLISDMRQNPRGPYARLNWYCADGTIHPPRAYACSKRGGGRQHATYSKARARLAEMGYHVGTIYAAADLPTHKPGERDYLRLRELPLEAYLVDVDDGWVLRRARSYRGRVQIEDEQAAGRDLLLRVLEGESWRDQDFLLARELVRTVPHSGQGEDPTRDIRRLSLVLAEQRPDFQALRAEIHGQPNATTLARVRDWQAAHPDLNTRSRALLSDLVAELDTIYSADASGHRLTAQIAALPARDAALVRELSQTGTSPTPGRLRVLVRGVAALRAAMRNGSAADNLARLDAMTTLEAALVTTAGQLPPPPTRRAALERARTLLEANRALGWLSADEAAAIDAPIATVLERHQMDAATYADIATRLHQAPAWAQGSVRHTFAESLSDYTALDHRADGFVDDMLRGSALVALAETTRRIAQDSAALSGVRASVFGDARVDVIGLNPGQATGPLVIASSDTRYGPEDIVVIPNTTSTLYPAAGIVTVGEGNPLSHIQILARNLGIPNVVVPRARLTDLAAHDGARVELAVTADGRVLLHDAPARIRAASDSVSGAKVSAPLPDLSATSPLPLARLNADLSGRSVGPKAANVGELAKRFPGRVAPAIALPFGVFAEQAAAPRARIAGAMADLRDGTITAADFGAQLVQARRQTAELKLSPVARAQLRAAMDRELGDVGVFIRSDTNMEDLPEFTGAGLNKTLPNVMGRAAQIDGISEVWASVYSDRAMAWRSRILDNPEDVFSSVLIMKSVASEKSGVLVTTDLTQSGAMGATVSVAWGVGGAVDNESAASWRLGAGGDTLLSEAKAPYSRTLDPEGGIAWVPAPKGGVLTPGERAQLRQLARDVVDRYPPSYGPDGEPLPFDVEFAFADGELQLLQIRPLVQRGADQAETVVSAVVPRARPTKPIPLDRPVAFQTVSPTE